LDSSLAQQLQGGCSALQLALSQSQSELLLGYLELLAKWNRAYNLTAIRDPGEMVCRHLLDSLAIAAHCPGDSVLDVGTGAGLPGIPLSIVYPDRQFHLLDSNGKKTRFLFQVKTELGLDNITVHHKRVESLTTAVGYDVILSRAFSSLIDMVDVCGHLLKADGYFLAMKGAYPEAELRVLGDAFEVQSVIPIDVPGLDEQRHLLVISRA
jgi:16S rRNA (guanine527-N7)-methyltransferase